MQFFRSKDLQDPGLLWFLILSLFLHLSLFLWPRETRKFHPSSSPLELEFDGGGWEGMVPEEPKVPVLPIFRPAPVKVVSQPVLSFQGDARITEKSLPEIKEVRVPVSEVLLGGVQAQVKLPGLPKKGKGQEVGARAPVSGYLLQIRRLIERKKRYPLRARLAGYQGEVTVSFVIAANGQVEETEILRPSPYEILNQAAKRTVERAAPFPPPPRELKPPLKLVVKLVYHLED